MKLKKLLISGFYPILFFFLIGIMKLVDNLFFQNLPALLRTVIFFTGILFGATLVYVVAILFFHLFFPRSPGEMELPHLRQAMEESQHEERG